MRAEDQTSWKILLVDTVRLFCENGLPYAKKVKIDGLIVVTLDDKDVIVTNIAKQHSGQNDVVFVQKAAASAPSFRGMTSATEAPVQVIVAPGQTSRESVVRSVLVPGFVRPQADVTVVGSNTQPVMCSPLPVITDCTAAPASRISTGSLPSSAGEVSLRSLTSSTPVAPPGVNGVTTKTGRIKVRIHDGVVIVDESPVKPPTVNPYRVQPSNDVVITYTERLPVKVIKTECTAGRKVAKKSTTRKRAPAKVNPITIAPACDDAALTERLSLTECVIAPVTSSAVCAPATSSAVTPRLITITPEVTENSVMPIMITPTSQTAVMIAPTGHSMNQIIITPSRHSEPSSRPPNNSNIKTGTTVTNLQSIAPVGKAGMVVALVSGQPTAVGLPQRTLVGRSPIYRQVAAPRPRGATIGITPAQVNSLLPAVSLLPRKQNQTTPQLFAIIQRTTAGGTPSSLVTRPPSSLVTRPLSVATTLGSATACLDGTSILVSSCAVTTLPNGCYEKPVLEKIEQTEAGEGRRDTGEKRGEDDEEDGSAPQSVSGSDSDPDYVVKTIRRSSIPPRVKTPRKIETKDYTEKCGFGSPKRRRRLGLKRKSSDTKVGRTPKVKSEDPLAGYDTLGFMETVSPRKVGRPRKTSPQKSGDTTIEHLALHDDAGGPQSAGKSGDVASRLFEDMMNRDADKCKSIDTASRPTSIIRPCVKSGDAISESGVNIADATNDACEKTSPDFTSHQNSDPTDRHKSDNSSDSTTSRQKSDDLTSLHKSDDPTSQKQSGGVNICQTSDNSTIPQTADDGTETGSCPKSDEMSEACRSLWQPKNMQCNS